MERAFQGRKIPRPALLAFLITFAIGSLDEFIQLFLPSRVFDIIDILFNGFSAFVALGASSTIRWVRKTMSND